MTIVQKFYGEVEVESATTAKGAVNKGQLDEAIAAIPQPELAEVAMSGDYDDLENKPNLSLLAPKESPTFTGVITIPDAEEETAPVSLQQLNSSINAINSILNGVALSINNLAARVGVLEESPTHGTVEVVKGSWINSVSGGVVDQPFGTTVSLSCTLKPQEPPKDTTHYTSFDGWYKDGAKVSNQMNYTFSLSIGTAGVYTAIAQAKAIPGGGTT